VYLKALNVQSKEEIGVFYSILDVLQDVRDEIDELNENLLC
jgi:hypothetical protein